MKSPKATSLERLFIITPLLCLAMVLGITSQALAGLNLEVPIEMVDYGLMSLQGTGTTNFKRSWVYLDPADYHNATYYFEIVAKNSNTTTPYDVYLRSTSTSTTYATITVNPNTLNPTRLPLTRSSTEWTPPTGKNEFLVRVDQTEFESDLEVYSARIIVQQTNADYTRIQIPMVHRHYSNVAAGPGFVDPRTVTTYGQTNPNRYCLWQKDMNNYADPDGSTPWTLEAVLDNESATATTYAALFKSTGEQISGAEVSNYGDVIILVDTAFSNTADNFTDGGLFELRIMTSINGAQAELRRASLYLKLTNLTRAEVLYRVAGRLKNTTANDFVQQRALVDTSLFSNPTVYFQASGWCADTDPRVYLRDHGTNDSGTGGSNVSGSGITFSPTKTVVRTSEISVTDGNRFYGRTENSTDNVELTSAFVVVQATSTACPSPGTPSMPSPADGAAGELIDVDLDWADCTDTDSYDVYFGEDPSPPYYGNTTSSDYTLPTLEYCTQYYWKIVARNDCGGSTTGNVWDFTTENGPPGTPSSPSPGDGETDVSANAVLDWADCTGTDTYDVYLGTDPSPPLHAWDITDSTYDPDLDWDTHYYWKIVANNDCGSSTEGPVWDFTTEPCPNPGTPSVPSPADGAIDVSTNADLDWADASNADSYDVYFGTNPDPPYEGNTVGSSYALPSLDYSTQYYWKIVANNDCGNSTTGPVWNFTTGSGTTHYVDKDNTSEQSPYDEPSKAAKTIQAAVSACSTGTVYVRKVTGTYGAVNMKTNVNVVGTDENWVPADASDFSDHPTIDSSTPGVTFAQNNCSLQGFKITGAGSINGAVFFDGTDIDGVTGVTISHCQISDTIMSGIVLRRVVGATIESCDIVNPGTSGLGSCITSAGMTDYILPGNSPIVIRGNTLHGAARAGIQLSGNSYGQFEITIGGSGTYANQIYDNGYAGVELVDLGSDCDVTIDNNSIYNNGTIGGDMYAGIHIENVSGGASSQGVVIQRNTIYNNNRGGVSVQGTSDVIIGAKLDQDPPWDYGNEIYGNYGGVQTGADTAVNINGDLVIRGNHIYSNSGVAGSTGGGIMLNAGVKGTVTISQNEIELNEMGGIGIRKAPAAADMLLIIEKNSIHDHVERGGIHTGNSNGGFTNPGCFDAASTIRQNKVYNNGNTSYGGGIDIRHFRGTIMNNLVYGNTRGGIRFGDYVTKIRNNTVANNGGNNYGGGIIYDDPASGAINDPPNGNPPAPLFIRNNICAYNETAGIRACFDNTLEERDYNLLYDNNNCGYRCSRRYMAKQLGGAGCDQPGGAEWATYDICGYEPQFVNTAIDDYHLQAGSPAENAGDDGNDMGAYGGSSPLIDLEIP